MRSFTRLFTVIVWACAAPFAASQATTTAVAQEPPGFMHVVVADDGEIRQSGQAYELVIEEDEIYHVLEFGQAPFGLANFVSADQLRRSWQQSSEQFNTGSDLYGTILSKQGSIENIQITGIAKTRRDLVLTFTTADNAPLDRRFLSDDIDDVTVVYQCCTGASPLWQWAP